MGQLREPSYLWRMRESWLYAFLCSRDSGHGFVSSFGRFEIWSV